MFITKEQALNCFAMPMPGPNRGHKLLSWGVRVRHGGRWAGGAVGLWRAGQGHRTPGHARMVPGCQHIQCRPTQPSRTSLPPVLPYRPYPPPRPLPAPSPGHMTSVTNLFSLFGTWAQFNPVTGASVEANNEAVHLFTGGLVAGLAVHASRMWTPALRMPWRAHGQGDAVCNTTHKMVLWCFITCSALLCCYFLGRHSC